jgi:hypothetical protein
MAAPHQQATSVAAPVVLRAVHGFAEPLIAIKSQAALNASALTKVVEAFGAKIDGDFVDRAKLFENFLETYPASPWRVSILTNLGIAYYHEGYFNKALTAWRGAWDAGKDATNPMLKAMADRTVGELARMHARVGHADELQKLFAEIGARAISGPATEMLTGSREGLWMFRNDPGLSYLCGPMALNSPTLPTTLTS